MYVVSNAKCKLLLLVRRNSAAVHLPGVLHEEIVDEHRSGQGQKRGSDFPFSSRVTKIITWYVKNVLLFPEC